MKFVVGLALLATSATAGEFSVSVRLLNRLTSYSTPKGTQFEAVVIRDATEGGRIRIPAGSVLTGRVHDARSIGVGVMRERAELTLMFHAYRLADGGSGSLDARVRGVDNAREQTTRDGRI